MIVDELSIDVTLASELLKKYGSVRSAVDAYLKNLQ
jgi:hypothetical protein